MADLFTNLYTPDVLTCIANLSNDEVITPPEVANKMLDLLPQELFRSKETKFLDPACKSGVFLREIAKRLIKGLEDQIPDLNERLDHIFKNQIYGIAITELTSLLSRRSLYCSKFASSKYSVVKFEKADGNVRFKKIPHSFENGKCVYCGASEKEYGKEKRGEELESHAYELIHTQRPEKIWNMKFDVIIGNPPYQLSTGGTTAQATPLYDKFVMQSKKLNPRFLIMITPSRWFSGGMGLDKYRKSMLSDKSIRKIVDYPNAKECFPGISIGGGVSYFLWDRDNKGDCEFTNVSNGKEITLIRDLNEFETFVRYNEALSIIRKIKSLDENDFSSIVSSLSPYGLDSSVRGAMEKGNHDLSVYSSKGKGYISSTELKQGNEFLPNYHVMMSKVTSEHAGEPSKEGTFKVISKMQLLYPNEVCTFSYFIIGNFITKEETKNCMIYLSTKFARFLLLQAISSINISKDKFKFVPLQDFSKPWTDEELYVKYNLTQEEIDFIESMIKPMDLGGGE